jgi:hypothetical protein
VYGLYWLFAVHVHLCRSIRRASGQSVPWWLAWLALVAPWLSLIEIAHRGIPWFFATIASEALWFVYMLLCDRARAQRRRRSAAP